MSSKVEKKLLHYAGKAIADFKMIETGDRVLACLSGGKDSFAMLNVLRLLQLRTNNRFQLHALMVDKKFPGWKDGQVRLWLEEKKIPFTIMESEIYKIMQAKERANISRCVLCSRLRRGHIYSFAKQNGYNKVALGHHRDDLITSLLMSIFYSGIISSMPPKLLTTDRQLVVIRPLAYCQEKDVKLYANEQQFPIIPGGLCGAENPNQTRIKTQQLIENLAKSNPKIPSNILHALSNVKPSQLMDRKLWDFTNFC